MTTLTTFGFEFEVATEAAALTRHLYDLGHTGDADMHRWHCDCDGCQLDSGNLFRAQTDSSCSGELITEVLHHSPDDHRYMPDVFDILQAAALEVDAEPGLTAGMHVHVGIGHLSGVQLRSALWAYMRYESVLCALAAGRWERQRENNESVRQLCSYPLHQFADEATNATSAMLHIEEHNDDLSRIQRDILDEHQAHDRHSNLNLSTNHGTWEFRLWNSTRSAWRMEMFTRLSVAMVDPTVVDALNASAFPQRTTPQAVDRFATLLLDHGHDRCAELVDRQARYSVEGAACAPSTLTSL